MLPKMCAVIVQSVTQFLLRFYLSNVLCRFESDISLVLVTLVKQTDLPLER